MFDFLGAIFAPIIEAIANLLVAILTPILTPVFELIAVILGAILHFILALIANLLGASWMAAHTKGLKRAAYLLMALTSAHLIAGIVLPVAGIGAATLLSWLFSAGAMLLSVALLILSGIFVLAADDNTPDADTPDTPAAQKTASISAAKELVSHGMAIVVVVMLATSVISMSIAQTERKSLRERLCDSAAEKVDQKWKDRGKKALDLSERLFKRDLSDKLPCPVKEN